MRSHTTLLAWAAAALAIGGISFAAENPLRLPLHFESNRGQGPREAPFVARGPRYLVSLTPREVLLRLASKAMLRIELAGANPEARLVAEGPLDSTSNYFIGDVPERWVTGAPHYEKVVCQSLYPGVDLVYRASDGEMELDWILAPGADPAVIAFRLEGADEIRLDATGNLVFSVDDLELRFTKPLLYQEDEEGRREIEGGYRLDSGNRVGFRVGAYDVERRLVIDPILSYSTYLGGSEFDLAHAVAVDSRGNAYVAGQSLSADFPSTGVIGPVSPNEFIAYVAKLDPSGSLVYATMLGGTDRLGLGNIQFDMMDIQVDDAGFVTLVFDASEPDLPTVNALQPNLGGLHDAFVAKLGPDGRTIVYSTYLGGQGEDFGRGIGLDWAGNAIVVGLTQSTDFPTHNASQPQLAGTADAFVTKLDPSGGSMVFSTFLGGNDLPVGDPFGDFGYDVAVDRFGNAYVTGFTSSPDFPAVEALQPTPGGGQHDAFVAKFSPSGSMLYSTYLGGSSIEEGLGITVDGEGAAYVVGWTQSEDFPIHLPLQSPLEGPADAFVTKISPDGRTLVYSTYLGGGFTENGYEVAVDSRGKAIVFGTTSSPDFPTHRALQPLYGGGPWDAFLTEILPDGSGLSSSTFFGGAGSENQAFTSVGMALSRSGNVFLAGSTDSTNFPVALPWQSTSAGSADAFIAKISTEPEVLLALTPNGASNSLAIRLRNGSTRARGVELKLWIRFDGGFGSLFPTDVHTSLSPSETRTFPTSTLPSFIVFPGSEVGARLLDSATGEVLSETICRTSPCQD